MSNPETHPREQLCRDGGLPGPWCEEHGGVPVEIIAPRLVPLGGPRAMTVRRTLPQRGRSMIGAWCFIDHYGPDDVSATGGMDVAPHPHTGLQTASWLFQGAIDHIDSGENAGRIVPGQLNLMTAGAGICHSEVSTADTARLHGVQLWLALPEAARSSAPRRFEHYAPGPVAFDGGDALVFLGRLLGCTAPVETHSPVVGAELRLHAGASLELEVDPEFEHGLLADAGLLSVEGVAIPAGAVGYTGIGAHRLRIANEGDGPARALLIGGAPFGEELVMWWNFVGRDSDEIAMFRQQWERGDARFGRVAGYVGHGGPGSNAQGMGRLPAPALPPLRLRPRRNPPPHVLPPAR